jgi:hypothetical protein
MIGLLPAGAAELHLRCWRRSSPSTDRRSSTCPHGDRDRRATVAMVALAERIELWPIESLRPYERNPRTHSDEQVDQLAASMVEFG